MDDPDKSGSESIPVLGAGPAGPAFLAGVRSRLVASQDPRETRKQRARQVLSGTVRDGVERGVVVLLDDRGVLLAQLMGGDPAVLSEGARVEVTGVFRHDLSTTAQQGPPFRVDSASPRDTPPGR